MAASAIGAPTLGGAIYRNGYKARPVKTTSGSMQLERPRVRGVSELNFESQVLGTGVARTHALEALIILGFLRGLSVRDVEDLLEEALGEQIVGKSTVARICQDTGHRRPRRPARRAPALSARAPQANQEHEPARAHVRRGPPAHQDHRPLPR